VSDVTAPRPWRCFVAVPLPGSLRDELRTWVAATRAAQDLEADWRWTEPDGWHLTLAFLGATPAEAVSAILERLARGLAGRAGFSVPAGGLGAFPSRNRARVLWYGIQDRDGRLAELATMVRAATGTDDEARFRPHVTLARARDRHGTMVPALPIETLPVGEVPVSGVWLMRSHLGSGPARYESLGEVALPAVAIGAPA
jgi:2'-5' RNA ligase